MSRLQLRFGFVGPILAGKARKVVPLLAFGKYFSLLQSLWKFPEDEGRIRLMENQKYPRDSYLFKVSGRVRHKPAPMKSKTLSRNEGRGL